MSDAVHMSFSDPIEVSLAPTGPVLRGVPFALDVTLVATWMDVEDASVWLETPEGVLATGSDDAVTDLPRDEPRRVRFELVATEAGTQEIVARAEGTTSASHTLGGNRVGFLVVPLVGPATFQLDLPPRAVSRTVGAPSVAEPVTLASTYLAANAGTEAGAAVPPIVPPDAPRRAFVEDATPAAAGADSHSTFQVTLCWFYQNEAGTDVAQRGATIQVWDEDDFSDDLLAEGVSGSDGCYNSGDISREDQDGGAGNQDMYVRMHLCDTWVCAQDADEDYAVYRFDYGTVGGEDVINLGNFKAADGDAMTARAFQYAYNSAWFARNKMQVPGFSNSGPRVDIWAPSSDDKCKPGGMFNRLEEDRIHVCGGADNSPDDVGHEYGHFVSDKLYGDSFWPSPNGAHNFCDDNQNRGLSWMEGWGNFYGPRVGLEVVAPSSDNNAAYDRPWNGGSFSVNMETSTWCGSGVVGDDTEMNVAQVLWDARDVEDDGLDTESTDNHFLAVVHGNCDNNNLREYFDSGCSWISNGGDGCTFMRAASQNNVDYDDNAPTVDVTSQGSFAWLRGTIATSANAADPDPGCVPSVEFRISHDSSCTADDILVGTDAFSPYSLTYNTATTFDDASVWSCARSSDGIENSPRDSSAMYGIDNTDPVLSRALSGTAGNAGWWRSNVEVIPSCSDAMSGVAEIAYSVDLAPFAVYSAPLIVSGEGSHILFLRCEDNAGNLDSSLEQIKIDTLDPSSTISTAGATGENGWYVGDVTVSLSCFDPTPGSGCLSTQVSHTSPDATVEVFTYAAAFVLTGDGHHTIAYHSVDVAGNTEATQSIDVAIDTMPPTGEITTVSDGIFSYTGAYAAGGLFTNQPTMTVYYHAGDAASGLQLVSILGDSDAYTGEHDANGALTISLPLGISTWTLVAEDMAGHTADLGTFSVARVSPNLVVDPKTSGWWKNAVHPTRYTQAQLDAMFPNINLGSHTFGTPDARYADISAANYATYLQSSPSTDDERVRKELAAAWLNLASGREPAGQTVNLAGSATWTSVVTNTGGSSMTRALNVVLEAEARLRENPDATMLTNIKSLLASFNTGAFNS